MKNKFLLWCIALFAGGYGQTFNTEPITEPKPEPVRVKRKKVAKTQPLNEKNRLRKEKFWMMQHDLSLKGIVWHNNKLYWATRELAEQNR